MLRRLYDRIMDIAAHRNAAAALGVVSFVESTVFPIPPDAFLIPMILANPAKAWRYALVCTVTSVLGGLLGYAIGALLYDAVGAALLEFYGHAAHFEEFATNYNKNGALYVFGAGLTPFPYKVITIASGATHMALPAFVAASAAARGMRFFAIAALLRFFGPSIRTFIEKYLGPITALFFLLVVAGFVAARYFS